jgi:hypothetical protein
MVPNEESTINQTLNYLSRNSERLWPATDNFSKGTLSSENQTADDKRIAPAIEIMFSDLRKRFTEFYRIKIRRQGEKNRYLWIRIVKNKPSEEILAALDKQYAIMEKLHDFLADNMIEGLHLTCSQPVVMLPEFNALVTKECSGQLFNSYLKRQIPLIKQKEIVKHCYNIGVWLKMFHKCFRQNRIQGSELTPYLDSYKAKYGKHPHEDMRFVTYCHNDYSPRNIFVADNFVEVIDFVGVQYDLPDADLHFFKNYMTHAKFNLLYPRTLKNNMLSAFEEGYLVEA